MAHLHQLVRAIPLAMALTLIPACERQDAAGDPRVDGITQTPMADPDLSILGDQKQRSPVSNNRPAPAASRTSTPTATNATGPEATPLTPPAEVPAPPTQPASATPPAPPVPG